MITVVCGPIGAGKSTWAREHFPRVADLDELQADAGKPAQMELVREWSRQGLGGAYITCFPTSQELELLGGLPAGSVRWVWIGTSEAQCLRNVRQRGRDRDLRDMAGVAEKNREIMARAQGSGIPWVFVDIFPTDERW